MKRRCMYYVLNRGVCGGIDRWEKAFLLGDSGGVLRKSGVLRHFASVTITDTHLQEDLEGHIKNF